MVENILEKLSLQNHWRECATIGDPLFHGFQGQKFPGLPTLFRPINFLGKF